MHFVRSITLTRGHSTTTVQVQVAARQGVALWTPLVEGSEGR